MEAARRAKQALNGADIYSGCCTLKIDYAKVSSGVTLVLETDQGVVFHLEKHCI